MLAINLLVLCGTLFLQLYQAPIVDGFPQTTIGDPITAIEGVVSRVLGQRYVSLFQYEVIPQENGYDVFEIDASLDAGKPILRGNNGVSLASALNMYLKYMCNCSISWGRNGTGDQLNLPVKLPLPIRKIRNVSPQKYRYYQNVCTVSYSMAWWDFARWERELDWMAMNGINLPLSFTGQEYVWQKFYLSLGLTHRDIKEYFSGPAFLAWQRMGNVRGWGGPLDDHWIKERGMLQKQILARSRQLGLMSVLPGFSGHVPSGISRLYPNASLVRSSTWGRFNSTYTKDYLLKPTDPLFFELANKFYTTLISEFGSDHFYNADTYNEMDPSNATDTFLAETNQAIYNSMTSVDPEAVFIMQGWLFHSSFWSTNHSRIKAFLSLVPNDKMIILDLNSESSPVWSLTDSYYGKPFVWCMLHNYGGVRGIYGNLTGIATDPVIARQAPGSTMIGTGITPEAIEHNPVMYDLMSEMGWRSESVDVDKWLQYYSARRYGSYNPLTEKAWNILKTSAYHNHFSHTIQSILVRAPGFSWTPDTRFNVSGLVEAWSLLYEASLIGIDSTIGPYQYDLVDIGRQCLADLFSDMYTMYILAYNKYCTRAIDSSKEMISISTEMLELLNLLDKYLGTNVNFLLGTWIADARNSASASSIASIEVVNNFEFNARNQITMWGPDENIDDYASKEWSGLINDYYKQRWKLFFNYTEQAVMNSIPFDDNGYKADRFKFETYFSYEVKSYPTEPIGDAMTMTKSLLQKYVISSLSEYMTVGDVDIPNSNLFSGDGPWTRNIGQIAYLCSMNPTCVGFNSNGLLKTDTVGMTASQGTILYLKLTTMNSSSHI